MTRVLLFAHRLSVAHGTGVVRYANELAAALDALDPPPAEYVLSSTAEPEPLAWTPRRLRVVRARGPRRAVHLSWCLAGRPLLERVTAQADIVHVLDPSFPVPTRIPFITTIHDLMPLQHPAWFPAAPRWAFRRGVEHARDHAAVIVTNSQRVADDTVDVLGVEPSRIRVIPAGVSGVFLRPVPPDEQEAVARRYGVRPGAFLLAVGAVSTRKNLARLFRALPPEAGPLLVAGPAGPGASAVRAEADRLGDRVRLLGHVPDRDLASLLAGATALVHPATYEGFGFTPLEAMATGTAVVVSGTGALPEVVGDAGVLVEPDDVDGWRAAIGRVVGDPELRATLARRGRERAARYRWDTTASGVAALHQEVLAQS